MRDLEKKRQELERRLKNKAYCFFYGKDRSVTNRLCTVFSEGEKGTCRERKYVKYKNMRYYFNVTPLPRPSLYTRYPPDGWPSLQVPVLCLQFFEGWQEELRPEAIVAGAMAPRQGVDGVGRGGEAVT